jgi:hypothetical protein
VYVVFGLGVAVSAVVSVLYAVIAFNPAGASSNLDPAVVRTGSEALAGIAAIVCLVQGAAIVGLVRGREWGRIMATIACVAWSLTCIGLPVAALVLNSIWRRPGGLTAPVN